MTNLFTESEARQMNSETVLVTRCVAERVINGSWQPEIDRKWGNDWEEHALINAKAKLACVIADLGSVHLIVRRLERQIAQKENDNNNNDEAGDNK